MGEKGEFGGIKHFSWNTSTRIEHRILASIYSSIKIIAVEEERLRPLSPVF
jgi:hypothetical protein